MSSHREAPEIAKDPVADSTDVYAFVSPDKPDSITLIANYIPLQGPNGGPNFFEFGEDVLYEIHIDNDGDGKADITYQFRFVTRNTNPDSFLYNTGPIQALSDPTWNRKQLLGSLTRLEKGKAPKVLASNLPLPPCNIGPLSTPNYPALANSAIRTVDGDTKLFCGQREDGFYVDLGSVFDLGNLRPIQQLHNKFGLTIPELNSPAAGVNGLKGLNVHTLALQIPKTKLTKGGYNPTDVMDPRSVIGVYTTASRQRASVRFDQTGTPTQVGPWTQVSRLGNPLFNEVLIQLRRKDFWNRSQPHNDSQFADRVKKPELASLLPVLYPNRFNNLAAFNASGKSRDDLVAILLTGIPAGVVDGFQNAGDGTQADLLRLNAAIPPSASPSNLGLIDGDAAGFPNGRRVFDDVVTVELRAVAGATLPLVTTYTPDAAVGVVGDGTSNGPTDLTAKGTVHYLPNFPYLGHPLDGYHAT